MAETMAPAVQSPKSDRGALERIAALEQRLAAQVAPAVRVELLGQMASLYVDHFSNLVKAIEAYQRVLYLDPTNPWALAALADLHTRRRDWTRLGALADRWLAQLPDQALRVRMLREIARAVSSHSPSRAVDFWQRVLREDPTHQEGAEMLQK